MVDLREVQLFSKLSDRNLAEIEAQSVVRSYSRESIVFYEGDRGDYLYIVIEGIVKLYKTSPKGTQIQINRFEAPAVVGEYACFERMPFPATCEFVTDGKMAMVPYEFIYRHLGEEDFSLEIIKSLTSKIMVLSALIHKETIFSSEAKVAKMLLENSEIFSKLKYNEVASILNLTPETLSRIFKKMKKEGIIEVDRQHRVFVLDPVALDQVIESNKIKTCTNCLADFKKQIGME
ncbi:Crp/Fnr family transcriptional regulator [Nitratifractor sp.]|uniref:Crp/Fnr family transcriptional regulator n=1 Tax=Nitratifractor sp. TaxID=2268144 RepID=UPI0025CF920D|nr:Crp/Fnr family transcriptional regulator [Nitratifractor sp.]